MTTPSDSKANLEPIAIIGMGCRFPGGVDSPESYWALMRDGINAITDVPADRWDMDALYSADRTQPGKTYVRRGGFLRDIDKFDPAFFGISPREAAHIDPQQRLLLEVAYEALEASGEPLERLRGSLTGVFVGLFIHDYAHIQLVERELIDAYTGTGTAMSIAANRVSYLFDLRGPSMAVDTACSSSLVALHLACESLRNGESHMALAGGVNAILRPEMTVAMSKASMLSPDGHCHTFDASANGYVRAEGAGMVVLKRLSDAVRDGNSIRAIIRATAVNQDGRTKGISVPNGEAQEALTREACLRAGITPAQIQYVEAHGTGTPVGDPIEANALGNVLSEGRPEDKPCVIGSVKSNMGHTESASGVAGLIKVVLCLENRQIPPNLHFHTANPKIDFTQLRMRVPLRLEPWPETQGPRLACLNSFGFGGTNAHAVLEEAPTRVAERSTVPMGSPFLLPLSAHGATALRSSAQRLRDYLASEENRDTPLADILYTAAVRRTHHQERLALVARDRAELIDQLDAHLAGNSRAYVAVGTSNPENPTHPAFLFTGMGPQWWAMGRQLLAEEPVFREAVEECDRLLGKLTDWSLLAELTRDEEESRIHETYIAQPAIFAVQVGLSRLLASWGVRPIAIAGHSVGEAAAAHVAGILSLADAVKVIYHRSRLQHRTAGQGRMLAVGMSEKEAREAIAEHERLVSVAAINSPTSLTLAGDAAVLERLQRELESRQVFARFLNVPVPYHSPAMEPLREELLASLKDISPRPAELPFYSTALGRRLEGPELDAQYWWQNVRAPVLFAQALEGLLEDEHQTFVEVGPHPVLSRSVQEVLNGRQGAVLPTLRRQTDERLSMWGTLGELYTRGYPVDWARLYARRPLALLPSYPWQRERYWDESKASEARRLGLQHQIIKMEAGRKHALLGSRLSLAQPTWSNELSELAFVKDHRVRDAVVYPGAAYLEMGIAAAGALSGHEPCSLEDVRFEHALFWPKGEQVQLQTVVAEGRLDIFSRIGDTQPWIRHMGGGLHPAAPAEGTSLERQALMDRLSEELTSELVYPLFEDIGLYYGPAFRGIERVWRGEREALARIETPEHLRAEVEQYGFHPAMLDACLHTLFCTLTIDGEDSDMRGDVYLPVRIRQFRFHRRPTGTLWSHARLRERHPDQWFEGDVLIYDEQGTLVAEALGLHCQNLHITDAALPDKLYKWLYEYVWEERALERGGTPPAGDAPWLVYADARGVGDRVGELLRRRGQRAILIRPGERFERTGEHTFRLDPRRPEDARELLAALPTASCAGVVHLWSLDAPSGEALSQAQLREVQALGYGSALHLSQALIAVTWPVPPRLWLVTHGVHPVSGGDSLHPAEAPLWGFGRVLGNEQPELRCSLVDLSSDIAPSEIDLLVEELLASGPEDEVALRGTRRHVHRFVRLDRTEPVSRQVRHTEVAYGLELPRRGSLDGLSLQECRREVPGPGEIEIQVKAVGLNFKDVMKATGLLPDSVMEDNFWGRALGMECSGVVTRTGAGVTGLREGDEVVAFARHAFRSHVTTDARLAVRKPAHLGFEEAATIPLAFGTAYYALHHLARLQAGEKVLIHAASGGVGQAAMMLARRAGAEIFATVGSEEKRSFVRRAGAAHVMSSRSVAFASEISATTGGTGVDIVLNSLAGEAIDRSLESLADYGRFLELGKIDIDKNRRLGMGILHRNTSVHGVDLDRLLAQRPALAGALLRELVGLFEARELEPLPMRVFPITEASEAFRYMAGAKHIGKVVITFPGEEVSVAQAGQVRFDAKATYLITGGFGGFGLELLRWLVTHGARNLLVLSRSGATSEAARLAVRELEAQGVRIRDERLDIADERQMARVLESVQRELPVLKGVFHTAAILDDDLLRNQTLAQYERVAASKQDGAWLLHKLTREAPLEHFVLFSSATSVLGNQGSGNYVAANCFLDTLAHYRKRLGLPALTVNWGLVANAGMATQQAHIRRHLERNGLIALHTRLGLRLMGLELQRGTTQVTIAPIDWERWLKFHLANDRPRFSQVAAEVTTSTGADSGPRRNTVLADQLAGAATEERMAIARTAIRERVAKVFGMAADKLEIDKTFTSLGLDSLMAIELRSKLEELGLAVSVAALLEGTSVSDLVTRVLETHGLAGGESSVSAPAVDAGNRWVVVPKPNSEAALRLFCFPYAGGAPTVFHNWSEELPASFEVCAINLPGRARRITEAAMPSIGAMADAMLEELVPLLDRPFAFFGHCMGSILMYEVAQRLRSRYGLTPVRIFVSGSMAPHLYQSPLVHEHADPKFLEILRLLDFTNTRALFEDEEMRGLMLPTLRADFEAVATYSRDFERRPPLSVPVTGFAGKKDLFAAPLSMTFWKDYTQAPFHLWMLDVHHYFVETHRTFLTRRIAADLAGDMRFEGAEAAVRAAGEMHQQAEAVRDEVHLDEAELTSSDTALAGRVRLHAANPQARLRLYCFPSALGRHPAACLLESRIADQLELCLIAQPSWKQGPLPGFAAQARALAHELAQHIDGPFAFFGHCTGSILMYEVARLLLREHGLQPVHMFTSGSAAPHLYVMPNAYLLPDEKIRELLQVIGHPLAEELAENEARARALMPSFRADFEMMAGYRYRHAGEQLLSCPITSLRSRGDLWAYFHGTEAWREHTTGAFEVVTHPGDHFFIEREPSLVIDTLSHALGLEK